MTGSTEVILAEIGDVARFATARKLAAWAGLTPTVRGSDLTVRHGHISKQGSAWLRWILREAAQTAKRHPDFAASYAAMAGRRGKKTPPPRSPANCSPAPTICSSTRRLEPTPRPRPGIAGRATTRRKPPRSVPPAPPGRTNPQTGTVTKAGRARNIA
jgi:hypothetical protein